MISDLKEYLKSITGTDILEDIPKIIHFDKLIKLIIKENNISVKNVCDNAGVSTDVYYKFINTDLSSDSKRFRIIRALGIRKEDVSIMIMLLMAYDKGINSLLKNYDKPSNDDIIVQIMSDIFLEEEKKYIKRIESRNKKKIKENLTISRYQ